MKYYLATTLLLLTACSGDNSGRAMGTLERDRITLTAPATETVTSVLVSEGQSVKQGDVLMTLDSTRAQAAVDAQQALLNQASARLAELQSGARKEERAAAAAALNGAQASLTEASRQLERARALRQQNLNSQADVDSAVARRDSARAAVQQAQEQVRELANGTRPEQLAQAEAAVASASAQLTSLHKALADLTLTATSDGQIDALPWHSGDRLNAGVIALTLLSDSDPYARVYLPANRLNAIHNGSAVQIKIDGVEQPLAGTVQNIRSQPAFTPYYALNERDRAALMYLSEIRFSDEALNTVRSLPSGRALSVVLP